jgi:hypothetical protein
LLSGLTGVAASASDAVYGAGWDGDTTGIASKNALYDKIETITSTSPWVDGGTTIYTTTSGDNIGIGTALSTSKLSVFGGGIKGEFVNKGYELISQPDFFLSQHPNYDFIEISSMMVRNGLLWLGYDMDTNADNNAYVYTWDGNAYSYLHNFGYGVSASATPTFGFGATAFLIDYKSKVYAGIHGNSNGEGDVYVLDETTTAPQLLFNGTTSTVTAPNSSANNAISGATSFSVEWKGQFNGSGESNAGRIVDKTLTTTATVGYALYTDSLQRVVFAIGEGGTQKATTTSTTVSYGTPVHIVATWASGASPKIYINGSEASYASSTSVTTPGDDTANVFTIGNRSGATDRTFHGFMSRLRVYRNTELTSGNVTTLYGNGTVAGSTAEYLFTDGTVGGVVGTTLTDTASAANHGTIANAIWDLSHWSISYDATTEKFAYSAAVFNGDLYVGMGYSASIINKFDGTTWSTAFSGASAAGLVLSMYVFNGRLYAALGGTDSVILSTADGVTWVEEHRITTYSEFNHFAEFRGKLYVNVIEGSGTNDILVRDNSAGTWYVISADLVGSQCWGMIEYNDALYVGCSISTGGKIYKSYDGETFNLDFNPSSEYDLGYEAFKVINYNGSLYWGYGGDSDTPASGAAAGKGANLVRKTDSIGQLWETDHKIISKFSFNSSGVNWYNDESSLNLHSPISFKNNVGINTLFPTRALDVIGDARISGLTSGECVQASTGGLLTTTGSACGSGGSITIGTTSPMTGAGSGTSFTLGVDETKLTLSNLGGAVTDAQVPNNITITNLSGTNTGDQTTITGNAGTATALAANGANCSSGNAPLGVDASGAVESCFDVATQAELDAVSSGAGGWTEGATDVYLTTSSDNVGIGTTITYAKLDVAYGQVAKVATGTLQGAFGSNSNNINGIEMQNKSTGASAEYRFSLVDDGSLNYMSVSMPGSGNTASLFGNTRSGIASIFTNGIGAGTGRILALGTVKANDVILGTNNAENVRIVSGGNVGIGTVNPLAKLQVGGDARIGNGTFSNTSANEDLYVEGNLEVDGTLYGDGSQLTGIAAGGWVDGGTNIYASPTTDNVAIGTTTPTQKLTVVGTVSATAFVGDGSGLTNLGASAWTDGGTNVYPATTTDQVAIGTTTPVSGAILTVNGTLAGSGSGPMAITNANVGIGTTTAGALLTIGSTGQATVSSAGAIATSSTVSVADDAYAAGWNGSTNVPTKNAIYDKIETISAGASGWTDGTNVIYATTTTDFVGIGTTIPTTSLDIKQSNAKIRINNAGTGANVFTTFGDSGANDVLEFGLEAAGDFRISNTGNFGLWMGTNDTERVRITNGGNVGIGSTSPRSLLEIDKGTGTAQITIDGTTGGCLMIQDTDGAGWTECDVLNGVMSCSTDADGVCD